MPAPNLTKGQRDRALMLRTIDAILRADYALDWAHDRFSSVETHVKSVYSTFDVSQWDRNFYRAARRYLAEYRDPNLCILPPADHPELDNDQGFSVRRRDDMLYVTRVWGAVALAPGDAITHIGHQRVADLGHLGRYWIRENSADRPSERWDLALAGARQVTLADKRVVALSEQARPQEPRAPKVERLDQGVVLVQMDEVAPVEIPDAPHGLILDLRLCGEGEFVDLESLLPYCIDRPTSLTELEHERVFRDTDNNRLRRSAMEARSPATTLSVVLPRGTGPTVLLTDQSTSGAAEYLVEAALSSPRCTVVGRPTNGATTTGCLCAAELGDGYVLVYPAAADARAAANTSYPIGCGLQPHIPIAWNPKPPGSSDAVVARALELLRNGGSRA